MVSQLFNLPITLRGEIQAGFNTFWHAGGVLQKPVLWLALVLFL